MDLGKKVKQFREDCGMTQEQLAHEVGIGQSMIAQVERGTKSLSFPTTIKIAEVLGKEVQDFV